MCSRSSVLEYGKGWGKSRIVETAEVGALAPDRPLPPEDVGDAAEATGGQDRILPAFVGTHPVTGKPVAAPPA